MTFCLLNVSINDHNRREEVGLYSAKCLFCIPMCPFLIYPASPILNHHHHHPHRASSSRENIHFKSHFKCPTREVIMSKFWASGSNLRGVNHDCRNKIRYLWSLTKCEICRMPLSMRRISTSQFSGHG